MEPLTLTYKLVDDLPLRIDVYTPELPATKGKAIVPAVVYFHPGGLFVGYRKDWIPIWLKREYSH